MSSFSHKTKIRLNSVSISCLSEEESVGACFCERRSVTFMQLFSRVHATLHLTLSVGRSVRRSVGRSLFTKHATYGDRPCFIRT